MATRKKRSDLTLREKRKLAIRKKINGSTERPRLCVYKSSKHTVAQIINDDNGVVVASASTQEKDVLSAIASTNAEGLHATTRSSKGVIAAKTVGLIVAKRALEKKVDRVVFDRNGNLYHGRIQAVADGAREQGLKF